MALIDLIKINVFIMVYCTNYKILLRQFKNGRNTLLNSIVCSILLCFANNQFGYNTFQTLPDEFRYHYSKLWLAIISQNREEMRLHSKELGIKKDLYPLFACIVTARPWDIIMSGINKSTPDQSEVG